MSIPLVPGFGVYVIVPSALTLAVPFVGVVTVGKVTFVKSVIGVPSGFLSFANTRIVVDKPAIAGLTSGFATGDGVMVTVTLAVSQTVGLAMSHIV